MSSILIGITGGSGSGKTTFIKKLRGHFNTEEVCVISQDEYYRPRSEQEKDREGIRNFDLPQSIDKQSFYRDLKILIEGKSIKRQEYTFNNEKAVPQELIFHPAPVIIVEGLFVLHYKKIRKLLDLKIFLNAKENLKVIRRIRRDQVERNYPLDDVLYRYEHHVLPTYEKYVKPYSEEADLIINNNLGFEMGLEVLVGYLQNYLGEQKG